jgi:hypothetical protein
MERRALAKIELPLDVRPLGDGMFVLTSPVARGIYIACRSVEEGCEKVQRVIDDLAEAQRSIEP